jgi:hypothetical protein
LSRWVSPGPLALTFAYALGCGSGAGFPDAAPKMDASNTPGSLSFTWTLGPDTGSDGGSGSGSGTDNDVTCASLGATTVQIGIVDANMSAFGQSFTCSFGAAVSGALFPSTYSLTFQLLGSAGLIATAPPQTGIVLTSNNTTVVPNIVFDVP